MAETSRSTTVVLWVVGVLFAVFMGGVYLVVLFVASVAQPRQAIEFEVNGPSCERVHDTEALVALTIAPRSASSVAGVRVDGVSLHGGQLTGVATLPTGARLETLTDGEHAAMAADLDDDDPFIDVAEEPRVVVLRLNREADSRVTIAGMTLWFAYGEPAAQQDVPLGVEWARTCSATLTD